MKIEKIYIDMDGVLADFDRGIEELCGLPVIDQTKKTEEQDNAMFEAMRKVDRFYYRLQPLPGAVEALTDLHQQFGDRCEILTGVPKPKRGIVNAGEDKKAWMKEKFDFKIEVNVVLRKDKPKRCQGSEYILIDDFEDNIREWEACGGTGILHTDWESTMEKLMQIEKEGM